MEEEEDVRGGRSTASTEEDDVHDEMRKGMEDEVDDARHRRRVGEDCRDEMTKWAQK